MGWEDQKVDVMQKMSAYTGKVRTYLVGKILTTDTSTNTQVLSKYKLMVEVTLKQCKYHLEICNAIYDYWKKYKCSKNKCRELRASLIAKQNRGIKAVKAAKIKRT